jgi:hypothetical protein
VDFHGHRLAIRKVATEVQDRNWEGCRLFVEYENVMAAIQHPFGFHRNRQKEYLAPSFVDQEQNGPPTDPPINIEISRII